MASAQDLFVQACGMGDAAKVRLLMRKGADLHLAGVGLPVPPLYAASQGYKAKGKDGHVKVVELLLEAGASPNNSTAPDGATPLHLAAELGFLKVAKALLRAGARTDVLRPDGTSPLRIACSQGHEGVVAALLEAGAAVDAGDMASGGWPLYEACQGGHAGIVNLLLQAGADKEAKNGFGMTPLFIAIIMDHMPVVDTLLKAGVDKEVVLNNQRQAYQNGMTPLILAAETKREGCALLLLAAGADPNKKTDEGKSAFDFMPSLERFRPSADGTRPVVLQDSRGALMAKSVKELKQMLLARGINLVGLVEKADLVDKLLSP